MLTQYLHMGGLERMIFNLSISLKDRGEWEPQVFVFDRLPDAGPENDLAPSFVSAGIPVTSFVKAPGFSAKAVLAIRRKLSEDAIPVVHTHDLGALIYGVCAKLLSFGRVRLVHTQHSFVHLANHRRYKYYELFFTRFADEIAVVSPDTQRAYMDLGVPQRRLRVVPNGMRFPERGAAGPGDKKRNRKDLVGRLELAARAALEPFLECHWLLYMARVHRTKGQDHALELWEKLSPAARGKTVLLFVGPESEPGRVKRLCADMEKASDPSRILYMGTTYRAELWLVCADLSLSCSEFEGMPLGPIEAAGAGLPLVLSEIAGHEVLKDWSLQYPLNDPAQGARMVERTITEIEARTDDDFNRAWEKAGEIRSRYALSTMSDAYARLYSSEARFS